MGVRIKFTNGRKRAKLDNKCLFIVLLRKRYVTIKYVYFQLVIAISDQKYVIHIQEFPKLMQSTGEIII